MSSLPEENLIGGSQKIQSLSDFSDQALQELINYLTINPPSLPIANVLGYKQFVNNAVTSASFLTAFFNEVDTEDAISSVSYADGAHAGPSISLPAGEFIVNFGASMQVNGGQIIHAGISVGGVAPADSSAIETEDSGNVSLARTLNLTLGSAATLDMVFKVGGSTGSARYRWLFALKIGS